MLIKIVHPRYPLKSHRDLVTKQCVSMYVVVVCVVCSGPSEKAAERQVSFALLRSPGIIYDQNGIIQLDDFNRTLTGCGIELVWLYGRTK